MTGLKATNSSVCFLHSIHKFSNTLTIPPLKTGKNCQLFAQQ